MKPSREEALIVLLLEKHTAERAAWLDRECASDLALRRRVEALLATHDQEAGSSSTQAGSATKVNPADEVRT